MSETAYLRETLNRRAKSLAHLRPLFELEANKGRYAELPLAKLDLFRFASALLDVIVTEMGGFHRGATYEQILSALTPQLLQAYLISIRRELTASPVSCWINLRMNGSGMPFACAIKPVHLMDTSNGHWQ